MPTKLVFIVTHGPEEPEKATIPFTMAVAAQAMEAEVVIGLQGAGAALAKKGAADGVTVPECAPLKELIKIFRGNGGRFITCAPNLFNHHVSEKELMDGVSVVDAGVFAEHFLTARNVMVY